MRSNHLARLVAATAASAVLLLGGCRLFGGSSPSAALFMLAPPPCEAMAGPSLGSVSVRRLTALPPFDVSAFVYRNEDGTWRIDPYDGFAADPSDMLALGMVQAFEASRRFDFVAYDMLAARSELLLEGAVEEFYSDFARVEGFEAKVRLRVYLSRRHGGHRGVVFTCVGEGRAPIASQTPGAVAEALSLAAGRAIEQIVRALPERLPEMPMDDRGVGTASPEEAKSGR